MSRRARAVAAVAAVVVAVAVAAVAGLAYLLTLTPLEFGGGFGGPSAALLGEQSDRPIYPVSFVGGAPVHWGVSVHNPSAVPITIRGIVPRPEGVVSLVTGERLAIQPGGDVGLNPASAQLATFDLAPDQYAYLDIGGQFVACSDAGAHFEAGTGEIVDFLSLQVSVLGIARTVDIPLPVEILFQAPTAADCPA